MSITNVLLVILSVVLVNNFIFSRFLGLCPYIGVSKDRQPAMGMGLAVIFVMTLASVASWSKKLDLLLHSADERREIRQFANDASHLQSLGRSLQHAAYILNARRCVCLVLDALKEKDPDHYESLCEIASGATS